MTFFIRLLRICNFPLFSQKCYLSSPFRKIYHFPSVLQNFPLISFDLSVFSMLYVFYAPPTLYWTRELGFCCSTTQVQRRCCLRSAAQAELIVPHSRTATRQRCAFSLAGPVTLKGLPAPLCQIPVDHSISFVSALKTIIFDR